MRSISSGMSLAADSAMNRKLFAFALSGLLLLGCRLALANGDSAGPSYQQHASIQEAAVAEIRSALSGQGTRVVAQADSIDDRLRLPLCTQALDAELPFAGTRSNRVTVEVRCAGEQPWKVYIPVRLATYGQVVVAARAISRDQILAAEDLTVAELELSSLRQDQLSDPKHVIGKKMRRAVAEGAPITASVLTTPPMIRRGQLVTVQASGSRVSIAMKNAVALRDAGFGEVIDVRVESSGRTLQAIVRSEQVVEVLLD